MSRLRVLLLVTSIAALAGFAQTTTTPTPSGPFTYSYLLPGGTTPTSVDAGGVVAFSPVVTGQTSTLKFIVASRAEGAWSIAEATVVGAGFVAGTANVLIPTGLSASVDVSFAPKVSGGSSGVLTIRLAGPNSQTQLVTFQLTGTGIEGIITSYLVNSGGNQTSVTDGGILRYPATPVGTRATATFFITNRSAATVALNSVDVFGDVYDLTGLPLLPTQIQAGAEVRFTIGFTPNTTPTATGLLTVVIGGASRTITLQGSGLASAITYEMTGPGAGTLVPNQTITFDPVPASTGKATVTVTVRNAGNLDAKVTTVDIAGTGFQFQTTPAMPATISAGGSISMTLLFIPQSVGDSTGRLRIDNVAFPLVGTGQGPKLVTTLLVGTTRLAASTNVTALPNISFGDRLTFAVEIANNGNLPSVVSNISAGGSGFSVINVPAMPYTIQPGAVFHADLIFSPQVIGLVNGTIDIDDSHYSIRVTVNAPPSLPTITFTNVTENMGPLQQPSVGIKLSAPYPLDVTGRMTLSFASDTFGDDPNILFVTGTRYADFKIPAKSTAAVFGVASPEVRFQTGSTAGVITISATFNIGPYDLTPAIPPAALVGIPATEPQIRSVTPTITDTGFSLLINGYSTPRSIQKFTFLLTPANGASLNTQTLSLDVESAFDQWYASGAGRSFGSQFAVTIPFTIAGDVNAIQSVSVTATNPKGVSAVKTTALKP